MRADHHAGLYWASRSWLITALVGQWLFVLYILSAFLLPTLQFDLPRVNDTGLITGHVAGDAIGNFGMITHILLGALLSAIGLLQLIPMIRQRWPAWHRWNGRVFLFGGLFSATVGLILTWVRGSRLSDLGAMGVTLNGILILVAATLAWYFARQRQYQRHSRWAIRALILISGVWLFRLFFSSWLMINQGPWGNNSTLSGPVDIAIGFGCYLLPLAIAEVYFKAQRQPNSRWPTIAASLIGISTLWMAFAIFATYMIMWRAYLY